MSRTVRIRSEGETLQADLYGELPAKRAVVLIHGQGWDADGWRDVAPRFVARGIPALALNLRGHDGPISPGLIGDFLSASRELPTCDDAALPVGQHSTPGAATADPGQVPGAAG